MVVADLASVSRQLALESLSLFLCLLSAGITGRLPHPSSFDMGAVDLNSGPYSSETRALSTEPTPQPQPLFKEEKNSIRLNPYQRH